MSNQWDDYQKPPRRSLHLREGITEETREKLLQETISVKHLVKYFLQGEIGRIQASKLDFVELEDILLGFAERISAHVYDQASKELLQQVQRSCVSTFQGVMAGIQVGKEGREENAG